MAVLLVLLTGKKKKLLFIFKSYTCNNYGCTSCPLGHWLLSSGDCICEDGYALVGSDCEKCHYTWFNKFLLFYAFSDTCNGISENECLTCDPATTYRE